MLEQVSEYRRKVGIWLSVAALAIGAFALFPVVGASARSNDSDIADTQVALRQCQLDLQYATTNRERADAEDCIAIKNKVLAGLTQTTPTPTPSTTPTTVPPTTTPTPTPTPTPTVTPTPSPTPTPTVTPTGPVMLNCLSTPSACGYPDATNTGVPAGTKLVAVSGNLNITAAGTIIDSKDITGCVSVSAANVIIRNSRIKNTCGWAVTANATNLQITNVEISCGGNPNKAIVMQQPATIDRVNAYGCEDGFYADNGGTIQNSYVHDLFDNSGGTQQHTDAIQLTAGGDNLKILHNTLVNNDPQGSSDVSIDTLGSTGIVVDNNLMSGGGYSMRCPTSGPNPNFAVTKNRFNARYTQFGPWNGCSNVQTSGNIRDETDAALVP